MKLNKNFILVTLLIEGASLMAVEVMGAKFLTPFYGSSLYVWTAVLSITVLGLTLGYFFGGRFSNQYASLKNLSILTCIAGLLVFAMPFSSKFAIEFTRTLPLIPGVVLASILLIVPPIFCFGLVGPFAVRLMTVNFREIGNAAGTVYFTSTIGGIFSTFLFGFYMIPFSGLKFSSMMVALALIFLPVLYFLMSFMGMSDQQGSVGVENEMVATDNTGKKSKIKAEAIPASVIFFAVIEGASVMAVELFAARMLAPYFGASLYVWAAVIGITLLSLAIGYFLGGRVADKYPQKNTLYWVMLLAALFTLCMHFVCSWLTFSLANMEMQTALIIVAILLMLPPLVFFGMIPTLLIRLLSSSTDQSGKTAGKVFSVSSASGILAMPIIGFYIIPSFGITGPSIMLGLLAGIFPFIKLISQKKYYSLSFLIIALFSFSQRATASSSTDVEVLEYSEGLLGQVLVADVNSIENGNYVQNRSLFVNRIGQTNINTATRNPNWNYVNFGISLASKLPAKSNALVVGLGGGAFANAFQQKLQLNVDAVELDRRIASSATDYFSLDNKVNVLIDDGRHYIETTPKKYDLVLFDVFKGEVVPSQIFSLECFKKTAAMLNSGGMVVINFNGFLTGTLGKAGRSVFRTLKEAGFKVYVLPTPGTERERNTLFIASKTLLDFENLRSPLLHNGIPVPIASLFLNENKIDSNADFLFTDDQPMLDKLNIEAGGVWRKDYNEVYVKLFKDNGVPLFK